MPFEALTLTLTLSFGDSAKFVAVKLVVPSVVAVVASVDSVSLYDINKKEEATDHSVDHRRPRQQDRSQQTRCPAQEDNKEDRSPLTGVLHKH